MARDRGGPPICFQALQIPVTDDRLTTWSAQNFLDTPMFNRPGAEHMWESYLGAGYEGARPPRTPRRTGLPTCPACRPHTSRPWISTRCATKASSTPTGC